MSTTDFRPRRDDPVDAGTKAGVLQVFVCMLLGELVDSGVVDRGRIERVLSNFEDSAADAVGEMIGSKHAAAAKAHAAGVRQLVRMARSAMDPVVEQ